MYACLETDTVFYMTPIFFNTVNYKYILIK